MDITSQLIKRILDEIKNETDVNIAYKNIIDMCRTEFPSKIWDEFNSMNPKNDIDPVKLWMQKNLALYPNATGIFLGLDTLNMENGEGTNLQIGLTSACEPTTLNDDWTYDCEYFGDEVLLKELFSVSDAFTNEKWTDDERSTSEYVVFLGYSGIVLREGLLDLITDNNFLSTWGFHDGDMFFLVNKIGNNRTIVAKIETE